MTVMALDLGEKRTGIAVSDTSKKLALPLKVVQTSEVFDKAPVFTRLLDDYEIEQFVVGLPLSLDGVERRQAKRIAAQAKKLEALYALPVKFVDERLSSAEAKRVLRQMGYSEKEMRGITDKIAAGIFLQTWLDSRSLT